ncbi:MAG: AAA family ATPase, partial [Nocardioidaceae bacterium]|nr:AAA family ATPase [Nocardioidaceae bacterium]
GMLDQDTARSLLAIADESKARIAFVGDRHQLPAVGRGGVLDHAIAWAHPSAVVSLEKVHRFADPDYAALSQQMRKGADPTKLFDELHRRGQIVIHASDVERTSALAEVGAAGDLVMTARREQAADINATIRDQRSGRHGEQGITTASGERLGVGDKVATRRNDPDLQVANRQTWTIAEISYDGGLVLRARGREHAVPAEYAQKYVELAYATTVHGAQGDTVDRAHVALNDATGAAAAYVAMTRGRESNTAHLVAESEEEARQQWVDTFRRDRADLGPAHARRQAIEAIDRYGPDGRRRSAPVPPPPAAAPIHDHGHGLSM